MSPYSATTGTMPHCSIMAPCGDIDLRPISRRTIYPCKSKFDGNSILLSSEFQWKWSLWNFAHGTTTVLSWHVQSFVAILYPSMALHKNQNFPLQFEWQQKILREMGPWFNIGSGNGLFPDFYFSVKHCFQSCRKIKIYYLLLNTEKTTSNRDWNATFNP